MWSLNLTPPFCRIADRIKCKYVICNVCKVRFISTAVLYFFSSKARGSRHALNPTANVRLVK